jgi:formate/nitrite transporter FocA (FNT family)
MYFIPLGLLIKAWAPASLWTHIGNSPDALDLLTVSGLIWNLVPVTIGNIIGGSVLVGGVYWFVYLRPDRQKS